MHDDRPGEELMVVSLAVHFAVRRSVARGDREAALRALSNEVLSVLAGAANDLEAAGAEVNAEQIYGVTI